MDLLKWMDRNMGWVLVIGFLCQLAFWGTVGYVVAHFIRKFW